MRFVRPVAAAFLLGYFVSHGVAIPLDVAPIVASVVLAYAVLFVAGFSRPEPLSRLERHGTRTTAAPRG